MASNGNTILVVVLTALILLFSTQSALARHALGLRKDGATAQGGLWGAQQAPDWIACGYFDSSDAYDPGVLHQPCYGPDNTVLFCWYVILEIGS